MVEEKEVEEVVEEEEGNKNSSITLRIKGDEDGFSFELEVISPEGIEKVEKAFLRVFKRVNYLLNGKKGERREVV